MYLIPCFAFIIAINAGRPTPKIFRTTTTTPSTTVATKLFDVQLNATWECGTDEFSKAISEAEILSKCPKLRDHINSCCYAHDQCYDDQQGQQFCDDSFCNCLERRTRSSKQCHDESSPLFCDLVKLFGDDAYKRSAPNATEESTLIEDYDYESKIQNTSYVLQ